MCFSLSQTEKSHVRHVFLFTIPVLEDIAQNSAPNELAISIAFCSIDSYAAGD
jgi:hypothetical protein